MQTDPGLLTQLARWAGEHAIPLNFVILGLLLTVTYACWWTLRRIIAPRGERTMPAPLPVLLRIAVGFVIIVVGARVFAELAEQLGAGEAMGPADLALSDALISSMSRPVLHVFAALTRLGDTTTLTVLCIAGAIALLARRQRRLAVGWVAAVAGNGVLNLALKEVFARVRPLHADGFGVAQGFSFPSGHSSGAVVTYGMLAYLALRLLQPRWHLPALVAAVAVAFTVGASRVFLRVHYASDVIAGFASGAAWLAVCITSIEFTQWRDQRGALHPGSTPMPPEASIGPAPKETRS
jgi:undecaprenyl-diphosphatase